MNKVFTIYSKNNCPLCDVMLTEVSGFLKNSDAACTVIKIDTDPELMQKYGARIPVLTYDNTVICEGKLDVSVLKKYLQEDPVSEG